MSELHTNKIASGELKRLGDNLLKAAYEFWEQHQKECGSHAVVWLKDDQGKLVIFTRGEYHQVLMDNIDKLWDGPPMEFSND